MKKIEKQLASESFINFVHRSNLEDVAKWEKWIQENPQHEELIERAVLVVKSLRFNPLAESEGDTQKHWQKLHNRIRKEAYTKTNRSSRKLTYGLVAALVGALISVAIWFHFWHNPMISFETDIVQKATLKLPDGSEVTLNRNSNIRYLKSWDNDSVRQVWLEGEAHFRVAPSTLDNGAYKRFEVYTDELVIDVVGTVFTVNTEDSNYVSLESGRVDIRKKGRKDSYTLQPGQSAQVNTVGDIVMSKMNMKPHISWVDGKILLKDNSLYEVIQFIEAGYGITVQCDDDTLLQRKLSGQVRLDNIDDLLHVLEKVLDLVIVRDENTVKIFEIKKHSIHV